MLVRGIRGAITIEKDSAAEILEATRELLERIQAENGFLSEEVASILFTVTNDITSIFPAAAARKLGWHKVPLLCFQEIEVPEALPRCIRVLVHVNTSKKQDEIKHIYLREARKLRLDLLD